VERSLELPEFDAKVSECREGVDDQSTAVTGDVIALVGIWLRLDRTVDADWVGHPFVFSPGMRLAHLCTGR
jgi:hypothetical protein